MSVVAPRSTVTERDFLVSLKILIKITIELFLCDNYVPHIYHTREQQSSVCAAMVKGCSYLYKVDNHVTQAAKLNVCSY